MYNTDSPITHYIQNTNWKVPMRKINQNSKSAGHLQLKLYGHKQVKIFNNPI